MFKLDVLKQKQGKFNGKKKEAFNEKSLNDEEINFDKYR